MKEVKKIAIIGTSPLSMLKAYLLAKTNSHVEIVLFDLHDRVGGAWYSDFSPKGYEIECGCHIWSHAPRSYAYIEKELGVPLFPFKTSPKFIGKGLKVPYGVKKTIDSYKFFAMSVFRGKLNFSKAVKENPNISGQIFGKKNLYPKLGSPELTNTLKAKLDQLVNVNFKLGFKINQLDIQDKVKVIGDVVLEFDQILLTSVSEIQEIRFQEKVVPIKTGRRDYIHLLIASDKSFIKTASYWRFMNDKVVHRIADISYQTNNEENLMLIGIKEAAFYAMSESERLDYCKELLKNQKLITENHQIQLVKEHIFPTYYIDGELRDEINGLNSEQIQLFHTTDIMYGMHFMLM